MRREKLEKNFGRLDEIIQFLRSEETAGSRRFKQGSDAEREHFARFATLQAVHSDCSKNNLREGNAQWSGSRAIFVEIFMK